MDNRGNGFDTMDDTRDSLWKMQDLFEIQRVNFSKYYIPSKHLAVDKVIVKLKGTVIFKPYIPQKRNISASVCINDVTPLATYTTLMCTWVRTDSRLHTWQHPTPQ